MNGSISFDELKLSAVAHEETQQRGELLFSASHRCTAISAHVPIRSFAQVTCSADRELRAEK